MQWTGHGHLDVGIGSLIFEYAERQGSQARELPGEAPAAILRILSWILSIPLVNTPTKRYNKLSVPRVRECFSFKYVTHWLAAKPFLGLSPCLCLLLRYLTRSERWISPVKTEFCSAVSNTQPEKSEKARSPPQFNSTNSIKIQIFFLFFLSLQGIHMIPSFFFAYNFYSPLPFSLLRAHTNHGKHR